MENVIYANGFEEHIEGLRTCSPKTNAARETNPEFLTRRRFDCMVLSWIYSSLTPKVMRQIVGYQTSNAAWSALEKIFSTSSKARIMQLRLAFQTTRKSSLSMMEYILKLKTITNNLAAIGEPVVERDQILQLLGDLKADYNPIIASLSARENDINLHSVHGFLLTHEQRLHFHNSIAEDESISAHIATQGHSLYSRKYQNGKLTPPFHNQNNSQRSQGRGQLGGHGQDHRIHHSGNRP